MQTCEATSSQQEALELFGSETSLKREWAKSGCVERRVDLSSHWKSGNQVIGKPNRQAIRGSGSA